MRSGAVAHDALPAGLLQSFIQNGVISGVGSVLVFLPQILILFLFILLLEDLGYMARAAFLMDRIMGGAGLHGRAFIPLLSSFACAIPGIMATRVIDNRRDRLTTILVAPLMTCSARIPVYTLIISAFIPDRPSLGLGRAAGAGDVRALCRRHLQRARACRSSPITSSGARTPRRRSCSNCPTTRLPRLRSVAHRACYTRAKMFLKRAGTTIFSMMVLIWFLASFPRPPAGADRAGDQLQPGGDDRPLDRAGAGADRLQLADQRRADPRHGGARGGGGRARHGLRHRGRQGSGGADRPDAGRPSGASRPRWRCWSGTSSRRNAPPRWR